MFQVLMFPLSSSGRVLMHSLRPSQAGRACGR